MAQTHLLSLPNKDLISSLVYNFYGTKLAASSFDHHIYVLSSDPATGRWPGPTSSQSTRGLSRHGHHLGVNTSHNPTHRSEGGIEGEGDGKTESWKAHDGPVIKVCWADPMYGDVIASCGTDGTVRIWDEDPRPIPTHPSINNAGPHSSLSKTSQWIQRGLLRDSYRSVRDVGFCPAELGLKLATLSSDSRLRIYECLDVGSLSDWTRVIDVDVLTLSVSGPRDSIVGSLGGSSTTAVIRGFDVLGTAPVIAPISTSALGSNSLRAMGPSASSFESTIGTGLGFGARSSTSSAGGSLESDGGWALSWCPEHWWGALLVVSAGTSGVLHVLRVGDGHSGIEVVADLTKVETSSKVTSGQVVGDGGVGPACSLAWAPPCGRNFHLVAAGHRDGRTRVWRLHAPALGPTERHGSDARGKGRVKDGGKTRKWRVDLDGELEEHVRLPGHKGRGGVGRCEWNVTGSVLSTSGADGIVRLWRTGYAGRWINVAEVSVENGEEADDDDRDE